MIYPSKELRAVERTSYQVDRPATMQETIASVDFTDLVLEEDLVPGNFTPEDLAALLDLVA